MHYCGVDSERWVANMKSFEIVIRDLVLESWLPKFPENEMIRLSTCDLLVSRGPTWTDPEIIGAIESNQLPERLYVVAGMLRAHIEDQRKRRKVEPRFPIGSLVELRDYNEEVKVVQFLSSTETYLCEHVDGSRVLYPESCITTED